MIFAWGAIFANRSLIHSILWMRIDRIRDRNETMTNPSSHVTIHMVASLDGFIARRDGRVDWLETSDEFVGGDDHGPGIH